MGEAVAAAMQHNIRLAYGDSLTAPATPPQVRALPRPSDDPHSLLGMFETRTRLAAAHSMFLGVQEQLEIARGGIAACPAELTDPRHHEVVNVLRTRELLSDVLGPDAAPPADRDPERNRHRAARTGSPQAAAQRTTSPASSSEVPISLSPPRTR
ncbi:hypothetical protein [Streptomyces sp. NBC_00696]|uniref:hypothetical protein n=1 Tax=Streptomyces sp. NBC_00696 TaxID=2903672 RepID=UPI002E31CD66|nr:hypothetical protein [Streptomyces sp. NBC_00696]